MRILAGVACWLSVTALAFDIRGLSGPTQPNDRGNIYPTVVYRRGDRVTFKECDPDVVCNADATEIVRTRTLDHGRYLDLLAEHFGLEPRRLRNHEATRRSYAELVTLLTGTIDAWEASSGTTAPGLADRVLNWPRFFALMGSNDALADARSRYFQGNRSLVNNHEGYRAFLRFADTQPDAGAIRRTVAELADRCPSDETPATREEPAAVRNARERLDALTRRGGIRERFTRAVAIKEKLDQGQDVTYERSEIGHEQSHWPMNYAVDFPPPRNPTEIYEVSTELTWAYALPAATYEEAVAECQRRNARLPTSDELAYSAPWLIPSAIGTAVPANREENEQPYKRVWAPSVVNGQRSYTYLTTPVSSQPARRTPVSVVCVSQRAH